MKSWARRLVAAAGLGLAALLAVGWFGAVHPAFDSVGHFRWHLGALGLAALATLAVLRMCRTALPLAAALVTSTVLAWPALPGFAPRDGPYDFAVAQQNLLFLNVLPEQAAKVLLATKADVLLLQEVSERNAGIVRRLADDYPHRTVCRFRKFRGVAVMSRAPFLGVPGCEPKSGLVSARVSIDGRAVTFSSLHTYWPWPHRQWPAVREIEAQLRALPHPLVLGGDFNAAPWSALVAKVADDTRTRLVGGFRFTFNLRILQRGDSRVGGLPLDHVLFSDGLRSAGVELLPHAGSDHLGTLARFRFEGAP